jgi:broad specificity phosphatase PhoE
VGTLTLVRHGQASLFSDDYDRLSPLGEQQAALLGAHWASQGTGFDRVVTGPRRRQRDTARIACDAHGEASGVRSLPEPDVAPEFDEMHAEELLRTRLPHLAEADETLRAMIEAMSIAGDPREAHRGFQRIFEHVMTRFVRGEIEAPEVESFEAFRARVEGGIRMLQADDRRGLRVVVFTSAGTIAAAIGAALALSGEKILDLAGVVRNGSITEIAWSKSRLTPVSFNAMPHLRDPRTWTHR